MNDQIFTRNQTEGREMIDLSKRVGKARKGRPDTLRRIAAKQGWYAAKAYHEAKSDDSPPGPPDHYKDFQDEAYFDGRNLAIDVFYEVGHWDTKQPFGEIGDPKVPI